MRADPALAEIWATREKIAAEQGFDVDALFAKYLRLEAAHVREKQSQISQHAELVQTSEADANNESSARTPLANTGRAVANKVLQLTSTIDRVGAPVSRGASHRTGLVLFTSGSSGRWVMTPTAGRLTTSRYPRDSKSCSGASMC